MYSMTRDENNHNEFAQKPPKLATVIVFVAAFAIIASWLGVYAVTNALIAAEVIKEWPVNADPRPRWMLTTFFAIFGAFTVISLMFQWMSWRQLKRIDEMADAEDRYAS